MKFKAILFDFDGTVVKSHIGVLNGVQYALKEKNINVEPKTDMMRFMGLPLEIGYAEVYGIDDKDLVKELVQIHRKYYEEKGIYEMELFENMRELLQELKHLPLKLAIASSKPEVFVLDGLKNLEIYEYFDVICGTLFKENNPDKTRILRRAMVEMGVACEDTLMLGDRKYDMNAAVSLNVHPVGVSYGYGTVDELKESGAKEIIDNPLDLLKII
ncbi:MAG: HAD hydrolase-like protein [Clostridia bacterium]|nr:HAD hydrolase-like protein [Clostridia bacterium]